MSTSTTMPLARRSYGIVFMISSSNAGVVVELGLLDSADHGVIDDAHAFLASQLEGVRGDVVDVAETSATGIVEQRGCV